MRLGHGKPVRVAEVDHRLVIPRCRAESLDELLDGEILAVAWALWVVKLIEEAGQFGSVGDGEHHSELQSLGGWEEAHPRRLPAGYFGAHVIVQHLQRLSSTRGPEQQERGRATNPAGTR